MSKWKNNLDEMQEQKLQRIESAGFWIAYWGLLAVMMIHLVRGGIEAGAGMLPEWALFMFLSVYIVVRCLRSGIWDRRLKANFKTNTHRSKAHEQSWYKVFWIFQYKLGLGMSS